MSIHDGHRARVKDRLLREGLAGFADHEVLELLLFYAIPQGDTNPTAHALLDKFGTLKNVFDADIKELKSTKGIGDNAATLIKLIPEITGVYSSLGLRDSYIIRNTQDAGLYACGKIGSLSKEVFSVICLDSKRAVIAFEILEHGTVSQASVHPRKVVECALRYNSAAVILAHNHPSGNATASENDRQLTKELCLLLDGIGINVLDHIITTSAHSYTSMSDHGLMPN